MEWTRQRRKRTSTIGSSIGVSSRVVHTSYTTTSTIGTTSFTSMGPSQFVGGGRGGQPLERNVKTTPTCGGGYLPKIGNFGNTKLEIEKEK